MGVRQASQTCGIDLSASGLTPSGWSLDHRSKPWVWVKGTAYFRMCSFRILTGSESRETGGVAPVGEK